jgi:hypothetical protein
MAPNGVRDDGTNTSTRAGTDWGRAGALWGAVGVLVAIAFGVLQLMQNDRSTPDVVPPSATSTATAATPDPTTEPTQADESTTDPASDPTADPTQSASSRGGAQPPDRVPAAPASSGPSISVSPSSVNRGGEIVIRGSGFPRLSGLHIRWFATSSISYELGRNVPADENGVLAAGGPMENPGFCGAGTVAVFTESGSSFEVPRFSEALATAPAVVRC